MKQDARSMVQEARGKMQDTRESLAFIQAFIAETQPITQEDAEDEARLMQMVEWAAEPRVDLSSDVVRQLITRVKCLM
jgi:hypothetical protein